YAATTSLALNGGTIRDAAGNAATLTLASPGATGSLGNAKALVIDTTAPTVTSVVRASNAAALTRGTTAPVFTVTTSESVTGLVAANFSVNAGAGIGGTAPTIASVTGSGTAWTVTLGVTGTTGNYGTTSTATLGLTVVPAGASVTDAAGNAVSSATVSGTTESYNLDTTAPTAAVTYSPGRTVKSGETLTITATFNEAMTTAPTIALGGTNTVAATAMTSTSPTVWTYAHSVASGNGNVTVTLGGTDTAGNSLGTVTGTTFEVDNTAPAVAITYQEIADNASVPTSGYLSSLAHSVRGAKSVAIQVTATEAGGGATLTGSPAVTVTETGASSATTVTLTETSSGSKVWRGVYDVPS
ncbi:MAG: hypothetical protein EBT22_14115, partial [Chloroflexi bacterium]|nr:hypothetical protein [Chloroflexota bacterium]